MLIFPFWVLGVWGLVQKSFQFVRFVREAKAKESVRACYRMTFFQKHEKKQKVTGLVWSRVVVGCCSYIYTSK
jgi:hypothetical protein